MLSLLPKSTTGLVLAVLYTAVALYTVYDDRRAQGGFLGGLMSRLIVAPASLIAEWLGSQVNFRSNLHMGAAIFLTATLLYWLGFGLGKGAQAIFTGLAR